jgi:hypothetical protein
MAAIIDTGEHAVKMRGFQAAVRDATEARVAERGARVEPVILFVLPSAILCGGMMLSLPDSVSAKPFVLVPLPGATGTGDREVNAHGIVETMQVDGLWRITRLPWCAIYACGFGGAVYWVDSRMPGMKETVAEHGKDNVTELLRDDCARVLWPTPRLVPLPAEAYESPTEIPATQQPFNASRLRVIKGG